MNRSFSKIRHIQEVNQKLEYRFLNEQTKVNDSNLTQFIKTPNKLVILDFTAEWCGPCQKMKKHFEDIMKNPNLSNKFILGSYDFESFQSPIAKKYGIQGIPLVMFFRNGKLVKKFMGYKDEKYLTSLIQTL